MRTSLVCLILLDYMFLMNVHGVHEMLFISTLILMTDELSQDLSSNQLLL